MKRAGFLLAANSMLLLTARPAFGAMQQRLAITISSDDHSLGAKEMERLLDSLTGKILSNHHFQVVDRKRLADVIAEQGFSNSDYADPKTAAALGRIVGASRILHVSASLEVDNNSGALVSNREADVSASFQLVGVDTARIVAAGTADGTGQRKAGDGSDTRIINQALDDCADDLAEQVEAAG
jgi:curli biogenesis system outer membrane secretion channel CsgG